MKYPALFAALGALLLMAAPSSANNPAYAPDLRRAFMDSCAGLSRQMVSPCQCVLEHIERSIPQAEFEQLLQSGRATNDPRVMAVARKCTGQ
jgi:hypothetical protein